jgi:SAM-dependent methyltransferase
LERDYARQYRDLYTRHWWWCAREEAILRVIHRRFSPNANLRILDVGCGDGLFFSRLAQFGEVEGVEPDGELVDPQGPYRARIRIASFDTNFCPREPYSLVLMLDVLEHLDKSCRGVAPRLFAARASGRAASHCPGISASLDKPRRDQPSPCALPARHASSFAPASWLCDS